MTKDKIKNLALILLLVVTVFSMVRYVSELKARFRLQDSLVQAQGKISILTQEKQNLLQELEKEQELNAQLAAKNTNLKVYLKASMKKIKRLFRDSSKAQNELEEANAKLTVLKAENRALIGIHRRIFSENERFKLKLGSVAELKKAIKELKSKRRKALGLEIEGNRGFLIKDGRLTSEKIIIEVTPATGRPMPFSEETGKLEE
ncbi:MAG: hypothetical protein PHS66_01475 [Candidatus Omnitrophica bacterium]|nr:hypothetical protein [Candidatus Omnitrophota bacterium]